MVSNANIGTTFSCSHITPFSNGPKDILASKKADLLLNRLFIEPSLGMGYPMEYVRVLKRIKAYIKEGDIENMAFDFDFIGVQNYTREVIKYSFFVPYLRAKIIKASSRSVKTSLMGWEIYPSSIYQMIKQFNQYKGVKKIIVTKNGAAFTDAVIKGEVNDAERLNYLKSHLTQVCKAKKEGLKVEGYFVWTFTDNFEWAEGYRLRFGLVYIDFSNQKRIIKSSGKWYKSFLAN